MGFVPVIRTAALVVLLSGCTANTLSVTGAETSMLPPEMTGRWILTAPNAPSCGMQFTARGAGEGTVLPEGGCPGDFYLARGWRLTGGKLVIAGDNAESAPLGTLEFSNNRFAGKDNAGVPITLARNSL